MDDSFSAIFIALIIFGAPVAAWIVNRVFKHRERMEMLRRGIVPPPEFSDKRAYRAWRAAGRPWPPPGMGAPQAPGPPGPQVAQAPWTQPPPHWVPGEDDPQRALFKGIRTAAVGLAILIGLSFIGGTPGSADFHGGPWLLGGLIPMFVGVAQILIAVLSGAQLPGVVPRTTFIPPPPPGPGMHAPPGFGSAGTPPPPPWADQPGRPRFEELSKPVPPPDLR